MFVSVFLTLAVSPLLPAQMRAEKPWWYVMEQGKSHFRAGRYGEALRAFEAARDQRRSVYIRMEQDLIGLLSLPDVRRLGDNLDWVERYIAEMHVVSAREALDEVYYRYGVENLAGSAYRALEVLGRLKNYPEAEFWIGETWRAEGETGIALAQYQKAWDERANLETPEFASEIRYRMADLHRMRQEYNEMESHLLAIAAEDTLWMEQGNSFIRAAMTRTLTSGQSENRINNFLLNYRYMNPASLRAHRLLGYYYYASNRPSAADHLMFVFLIENSTLLDEIIRRDYSYTFTTLDDVLDIAAGRRELAEWIEENGYFRSMYYLGMRLYADGYSQAAREFWTVLARRPEAGEFYVRAAAQLRRQTPLLEPVVEAP
jgi:tetratricopeptide (TPR) repeat protein